MIPPIEPGGKPLALGEATYHRGDMREKRGVALFIVAGRLEDLGLRTRWR
jgi:hypothetical protein